MKQIQLVETNSTANSQATIDNKHHNRTELGHNICNVQTIELIKSAISLNKANSRNLEIFDIQ